MNKITLFNIKAKVGDKVTNMGSSTPGKGLTENAANQALKDYRRLFPGVDFYLEKSGEVEV